MYDYFLVSIWPKVERLGGQAGAWLDEHAVNIIVILIGAWLVRHFSTNLISRVLRHTVRPDLYPTKTEREKRIKTLNSMVGAGARAAVYVIAAILIVGEIHPSYATALFASAGLIGVAIGFGAKDLIKDFMSGIFIITENQYRVGDIIQIAGVSGVVEDITIRTTVLRDIDGNVHHVPNGTVQVTTNHTLAFSHLHEEILVGYDTDIDKLEHVINHLGEELAADPELKEKILEAPRFVRVDAFGDNGMVVKVLGKTVPGEQWKIKGEWYRRLKKAFDRNHIEIPFPHVVVQERRKAKG